MTELINAQETAAILGLSYSHIRRLIASGEIPHYKIGHAVRINPVELQEWLEEKSIRPGR